MNAAHRANKRAYRLRRLNERSESLSKELDREKRQADPNRFTIKSMEKDLKALGEKLKRITAGGVQ